MPELAGPGAARHCQGRSAPKHAWERRSPNSTGTDAGACGAGSNAGPICVWVQIRQIPPPFLLLALRAASFGMGGGELASYQLFRSLGDAMLAAPHGALAGLAEPVWSLVTLQRDGLHYPHLLLGGTGALILYAILLRSGWVPRWLAIAGLLATASQMTGVFTGILNGEVLFQFLVPLALVQLIAGLWLVARGFSGGMLPERIKFQENQ